LRGGKADAVCTSGINVTTEGCIDENLPEPAPREVCTAEGNPIEARTSRKVQTFTDFTTEGPRPLVFQRRYISQNNHYAAQMAKRLGRKWTTNFDGSVFFDGTAAHASHVYMSLPDGSELVFRLVGGNYVQAWYDFNVNWKTPAKSDAATLTKHTSTYELKTISGVVYVFDFNGHLTEIRERNGYALTLTYSGNLNDTVTDSLGRSISFAYDAAGLMTSATMPDGSVIQFEYEDVLGVNATIQSYYPGAAPVTDHFGWALKRVIYPDDTPGTNTDNPKVTYHYEDTNYPDALTGMTDERGIRFATWAYDSAGRAISSTHAGGVNETLLDYSVSDEVTVTSVLGREAILRFQTTSERQRQLIARDGQATAHCAAADTDYAYDTAGFVSQITDAEGRITKFTNNSRGLPTETKEAFGTTDERIITYTWHATYDVPTQIVSPGLTIDNTYNGNGSLTQSVLTDTTTQTVPYSTNGQTRTWTYGYTTEGLLEFADGPLSGTSDRTTYDYDTDGYLTEIENGLGHVTDIVTVNGRGQPTEIEDPNGTTTTIEYDPRGRPVAIVVNPGASQSAYGIEYTLAGDVAMLTKPNGATLEYTYDDARRITQIENAAGERIEFDYNLASQVTRRDVKTSGGTIVETAEATYDELGRLLKVIGAAAQETEFAYDRVDNLTSITDPRNKVYGNTFDALNRVVTETDPDNFDIDTTYTAQDDVASVADPRSLTTTYIRNGFGDVIRRVSPDTGTTDFWYDQGGRVIEQLDARGLVTDFAWDGLGRMTAMTFPAQPGINRTYSYDSTASGNKGIGRLTQAIDGSGNTRYTYDAQGRIVSVLQGINGKSYTTAYQWDAAGNLTKLTYPSGRVVTVGRDAEGRISGVVTRPTSGGSDVTVASSFVWNPFGPPKELTFGNALKLFLAYDQDGRLVDLEARGGGTRVQDLEYTYDDASNLTAITDLRNSGRSQTFTYDDLNRLDTAAGNYGTVDYAYDGVGNRTGLVQSSPSATDSYTYDTGSNRLLSIARSGGFTRTFAWFATGQMSGDTRSASTAYTYTIDTLGDLRTVRLNGTVVATYAYDASDRRVSKTVGSTVTQYIYDLAGRLIAEADGTTGGTLKEYIWADDLPIGYVTDVTTTPVLYYIHADHLKAPQKITDAAKAIVWDGQFRPFGEERTITGTLTQNLRFPGQFFDAESLLHQNWNRDYDPSTGRYIQSDRIGLSGGINTYSYVDGNPITSIDPEGERLRRRQPQWWEYRPNYGGGPPVDSPENKALSDAIGNLVDLMNPWHGEQSSPSISDEPESCATPLPPPVVVPGTRLDPWPPDCDERQRAVDEAKDYTGHLGGCKQGMELYDLVRRKGAWLDEAQSRARRDEKCWAGGNVGHQEAQAKAWEMVGKCEKMIEGF